MDKQDIRYVVAFLLGMLGFLAIIGTLGKYELQGYIPSAEFVGKMLVGFGLLAATFMLGDVVDEFRELIAEKAKNACERQAKKDGKK